MAHSSEHDGTKALADVHDTCKDTPHTMHDLSMLKHAHYADKTTPNSTSEVQPRPAGARARLGPGWEYTVLCRA